MKLVHVAALPLAALALCVAGPASAIEAGNAAPEFALSDFEGNAVTLSSLRGKVVVLNFWASWCAPCRAELPLLDELAAEQVDDGVVYLAVNIDERDRKARLVWDRLGLQMPTVWDPEQVTVAAFDPPAMPTTYVIDAQGKVRWVEQGAVEPDSMVAFGSRVAELATAAAVLETEAGTITAPSTEPVGAAEPPEAAPETAEPAGAPLVAPAPQE